jgi:hypothetical protein
MSLSEFIPILRIKQRNLYSNIRDPARYNFKTDFYNLQFLSSCVFKFDDLMMAF